MTGKSLFRTLGAVLAAATVALTLWHPATATPISPDDPGLTSLGTLPGGNLLIDTGTSGDATSLPTLTFGGGSLTGTIISQSGGPDIAAFLFADNSVLAAGDVISVTGGSRPLALLFDGGATLQGTIDVSGGTGASGGADTTGGPGTGVAGGGNGGVGCCFNTPSGDGAPGSGPGGGENGASSATVHGPGAGGGFGTDGGDTGASQTFVLGGLAYGDPLSNILQGGSGGGGGGGCCVLGRHFQGASGGGAGGGAIEIGALTLLDLVGADILANGGDGGVGGTNGGGGSGGGILLHAFNVALDSGSLLQANGGNGGGCGGAGRIEILTNTQGGFSNDGTVEAKGGEVSAGCNDGQLLATSLDTIGTAAGDGTPPSTPPSTAVSAPGTFGVFGLGLVCLGIARRRRAARA